MIFCHAACVCTVSTSQLVGKDLRNKTEIFDPNLADDHLVATRDVYLAGFKDVVALSQDVDLEGVLSQRLKKTDSCLPIVPCCCFWTL
jgi:hypothetical protein